MIADDLQTAPSFPQVMRHLDEWAANLPPAVVIGQDNDIVALTKQIPSLRHRPIQELDLKTWREREKAPYSKVALEKWNRLKQHFPCHKLHQRMYWPSQYYREGKGKSKVWYGYHCARKDVCFMIAALRHGIQTHPHPTAARPAGGIFRQKETAKTIYVTLTEPID